MFDYLDGFLFGMGRKRGSYKGAVRDMQIKRNVNYWNIFTMLVTLVANRFKPKKGAFPDTMDYRYLMYCMINTGKAGITKIDNKIRNLDVISENNQSMYGYSIKCELVDYAGKNYGSFIPNSKVLDDVADCAIVYLSDTNIPPISRIWWYAERLNEIQTAISVAIANTKASVSISCEKEQVEVIKKMWLEAGNGLPLFVTYDGSSQFGNKPELISNPQTGDVLKVLIETYDKYLSDFCGEFGINNNDVMNKLSGVSDEELEQNEQKNSIILNDTLNKVREGLKKASDMFGEEIDIELNFDNSYNVDGSDNTERKVTDNVENENV